MSRPPVQAFAGDEYDEARRKGTPAVDDVRVAVEAERQRAAAHAREGYRGNENCDDITKRILSGEPAADEIPGRVWGPPADDVLEAAGVLIETAIREEQKRIAALPDSMKTWTGEQFRAWSNGMSNAARIARGALETAAEVRPHGTVTDAEGAWEYGVDDVGMHPEGHPWADRGEKRPIDLAVTLEMPGRLRRWYGVDTIYRRRAAGPWEPFDLEAAREVHP